MEIQIIEKLGHAGISTMFAFALLNLIKGQLKDIRSEVRTVINSTLQADNQMRAEIFRQRERIRQLEFQVKSLRAYVPKKVMN